MLGRTRHKITEAEFFAWLVTQERRHELVDGEILVVPGNDVRHDTIVVNMIALLHTQLRRHRCAVNTAATAIRIPNGNIRFPDLSVDCGDRADDAMTAAEPKLVVDVLSQSTRPFDREDRLEDYKSITTLDTILLVNPEFPEVRLFARGPGRAWDREAIDGLDHTIELPRIGVSLALSDIYDGLTFGPRPRLVIATE